MKKFALSFAALALTAGSALAADLPSRKAAPVLPPPPPPPATWTGFYVGLNAGVGFGNSSSIQTTGGPIAVANPLLPSVAWGPLAGALAASASSYVSGGGNTRFIGGGQVGYNFQFAHSFVAGLEADIQGIAGSGGAGTSALVAPLAVFSSESYLGVTSASRSIDYIGTVRGRLGWLFTPTLLVYGTGGLAYGGVNLNTAYAGSEGPSFAGFPVFGSTSYSDTKIGWTAGGGVEWMFLPNWSAKVEYLYYDLGRVTSSSALVHNVSVLGAVAGAATQTSTHFNGNIVRAGVNYHFNWGAPAPVVAKY